MNHMAAPVSTTPPRTGVEDDEAEITAVIRAETQAIVDADFDTWKRCWVHDERIREVGVTAMTGQTVTNGWEELSALTEHALQNGLGCGMVRFRQENFRITVEGDIAWVVFDQWSENLDGATWENFETRILERNDDGWKIVYLSFVEQRSVHVVKDVLSVDAKGHLIWASPETLERVKRHPVLAISRGRVRARRRDWDRALQAAITRAGRFHGFYALIRFAQKTGGPFRYPAVLGDTDEGGVAVVDVSVRDCTTYLRFDGDKSLDRRLSVAQAVFGLSDGQLRVARHIADGAGLKNAAEALGISVNTARTHLYRLYDKTGVNSQTALVRLLLSVG